MSHKRLLMLFGIFTALLLCAPVASAVTYTIHEDRPSEILLLLFIVIDFVLLFYALSDHDNVFYANITIGVMSIILSFVLSAMMIGGYVNSIVMVANNTTGVDFAYDTYNTVGHSTGIGIFMLVIGLVMIVHTVMYIVQIYREMENEFEFN